MTKGRSRLSLTQSAIMAFLARFLSCVIGSFCVLAAVTDDCELCQNEISALTTNVNGVDGALGHGGDLHSPSACTKSPHLYSLFVHNSFILPLLDLNCLFWTVILHSDWLREHQPRFHTLQKHVILHGLVFISRWLAYEENTRPNGFNIRKCK